MVEKLKKTEGENKGLRKDINNMRAVINTSAPSLGEEGTKTIEDLKRQIVLMEEENIKLFNEKNIFMSHKKPPLQVLLPLIPPLAQKLLQKKFSPYPYCNPLKTNLLMNVLQTSDVKVTASIEPVAK